MADIPRQQRPTGPETENALIRAALHEQGKLLGQMHQMILMMSQQVEAIRLHLGV